MTIAQAQSLLEQKIYQYKNNQDTLEILEEMLTELNAALEDGEMDLYDDTTTSELDELFDQARLHLQENYLTSVRQVSFEF